MNCPLEEFHFTMVSFHFYKDFRFQFLLNHSNKQFIFMKLQFTKKKKKAINQGLCVNSRKHLLLFSRSVVSGSLRPHGPQHARPPCPSAVPF